ncbi:MAG: MinD/ParA family protein [Anaerolineae bacterium]|nr:MinD/ParA family protein [Anaerolineae bacterium]
MSKIVSIHSFRGGTGKSNTTANIAAQVALQGNRVAIVDTDIQSPGIHVLFGMEEDDVNLSLNDYLWGKCAIHEAVYDVGAKLHLADGTVGLPQGQLYLIPSSIRPNEIAKVLREGYDVGMLSDGFQDAIEQLDLDYFFIDTHPGLNEETLLSIAISDILLLIMRPDRQDFQGTAVTVDVSRRLDIPNLFLIVNKALPEYDFAALTKQVEETYRTHVAGMLPLSTDVARMSSADIFSLRFPDHEWSQTIMKIAAQVMAC